MVAPTGLWALLFLGVGVVDGSTTSQVCGKPAIVNRIVGGSNAPKGAWPWQVSIRYNGSTICGGSLITDRWVLSAAHCFQKPINTSLFLVRLGAYQLSYISPTEISSAVSQIIVHSNYTGTVRSFGDIALLELKSPVTYTDYILPVCLPASSAKIPEGMQCWVTGWGRINSSEFLPSPRTLQQVQVSIVNKTTCDAMYHVNSPASPNFELVHDDMLCAGYAEGGKDVCQGDSGGPLVCKTDSIWVQAGIVSWGDGCAQPNRPGVYTSVSAYFDWITECVPDVATNGAATTSMQTSMGSGSSNIEPSNNDTLNSSQLHTLSLSGSNVNTTLLPLTTSGPTIAFPCGRPTFASRIVGGLDAQNGQWPWQVSVRCNITHACGGTLITERWVVSAASCFKECLLSDVTVVLGALALLDGSTNAQVVISLVKNITLNPSYLPTRGSVGDIALLELQDAVNLTNVIRPICLPNATVQLPNGKRCWVTGWGNVHPGVPLQAPQTLQEAEVPLIDAQTCDSLYHLNNTNLTASTTYVQDDMICAGYRQGDMDYCQGDSGGPLACQQEGIWFLAGIVSDGQGCGSANRPGLYTRVPVYTNWIKENVPDVGKNILNMAVTLDDKAAAQCTAASVFLILTMAATLISNLWNAT